jgi:secreted PhoX family phosphatase
MFQGGPDQIKRILDDDSGILYFTEDGGQRAGVHARDMNGNYYTILESATNDGIETTGLSFSPDHKSMYIAFQKLGLLFSVSRNDGLPFDGRSLNVKYHNSAAR